MFMCINGNWRTRNNFLLIFRKPQQNELTNFKFLVYVRVRVSCSKSGTTSNKNLRELLGKHSFAHVNLDLQEDNRNIV